MLSKTWKLFQVTRRTEGRWNFPLHSWVTQGNRWLQSMAAPSFSEQVVQGGSSQAGSGIYPVSPAQLVISSLLTSMILLPKRGFDKSIRELVIKKADRPRINAFKLWSRGLLRVPWTARRSNQSILKETSHWKEWCWSCSSNILATWCEELAHWKDPDAWKDWGQENRAAEDEMVGWLHWLSGHEFEGTPEDSERQGSLVCYSPWSARSQTKQQQQIWELNNYSTNIKDRRVLCQQVWRDGSSKFPYQDKWNIDNGEKYQECRSTKGRSFTVSNTYCDTK